jgi:hypothetical protein
VVGELTDASGLDDCETEGTVTTSSDENEIMS